MSFFYLNFLKEKPKNFVILERKTDSSGLDLMLAEQDLANYEPAGTNSPPKDKEVASGDKKTRLFRTASGTASNKKKQTLNFTTSEPHQAPLRNVLEACLSPTNVEPRKVLLDQLSKVFTPELNFLPDVVILVGPQEQFGGAAASAKLSTALSSAFKPTFSPQNTAEVKAILSTLMNKIHK